MAPPVDVRKRVVAQEDSRRRESRVAIVCVKAAYSNQIIPQNLLTHNLRTQIFWLLCFYSFPESILWLNIVTVSSSYLL